MRKELPHLDCVRPRRPGMQQQFHVVSCLESRNPSICSKIHHRLMSGRCSKSRLHSFYRSLGMNSINSKVLQHQEIIAPQSQHASPSLAQLAAPEMKEN
ncbi:hypothetical protein L596_030648 [Steinernema carpocapsae]|uniref:Uncharacterized protein n=1 Tax=Steinernema carpocapsae TaxID=34508 RepID=A0A4U5LQ24_STECR|nr:hypothetical protein L596_030648 [Steinernema carpocapsae]